MKKILLLTFFVFSSGFVNASYEYNTDSINSFVNSPSLAEIKQIKDRKTRVCEEVFLKAYMRREFSDLENRLCSDIFERKIEAELNYKRYFMKKRGIY